MVQRRRHGRIRGPKPSRSNRPKSYRIVCAACGQEGRTPTIVKRGDVMIKKGDVFKNIDSGTMFTVKSVDSSIVILGTKDGTHSMFVNPNSIESVFVPFIEDEVKEPR